MRDMKPVKDVDSYLKLVPAEARPMLQKLRALIQAAAPKAEEVISYGMPMYKQYGMLAGFMAAKNHCGFYPGGIVQKYKDELKDYKTSKGTIRLPYDKPIPVTLIRKIVKENLKRNIEKQKERELKKKKK